MITLLVILEIITLCLGATVFLCRPTMRVSEALCSGIIVTLLTLSCLYQVVFLIGEPRVSFIVEISLVIASLILLKRRSNYLGLFWKKTVQFGQQNKALTGLASLTLLYLALQAIILPPIGPDFHSYHLPKVLLFQQEKSLYLENVTNLLQAIFPVGWDILYHAFLRFYTDYGLGIFAFFVYLAIGFGTYALVRQITSRQIAVVTTLVVMTMPQVVMQSTSINTDLPLASVAVFCLLTLSRLCQQGKVFDLALLILGMAFGLSIKLTFLLFLAPFILFGGYLLLRNYSLTYWIKLVLSHWKLLVILIFPVVIFSQLWLYIHNHYYWGGWSGPPDFINHFQQNDGLKGAVANLIRYLFESIHLMQPTDIISYNLFHIQLSDQLEKIYNKLIYPLVGDAGILPNPVSYTGNSPFAFNIEWRFVEIYTWYGLFGFLLSIPSLLYATIRGKHLVRIVGLILLCFFLLVSYKVGWSPWRGRYFSLFFVSSGICIAHTLDSLSLWLKDKTKILLKLIIITCFITLFMIIAFSEDKGILNLNEIAQGKTSPGQIVKQIVKDNVWVRSQFGQKRKHQRIAKELVNIIPSGSKVALLANWNDNVYNYLFALPSVYFVPVHASSYPKLKYKIEGLQSQYTNYQFPDPLKSSPDRFDYLLCIDVECEVDNGELCNTSRQVIWHFKPSKGHETQLLNLH